jgi:hypothetical protein
VAGVMSASDSPIIQLYCPNTQWQKSNKVNNFLFHIDMYRYVDKSLKFKGLTSIIFDNLLSNIPETSTFHGNEE